MHTLKRTALVTLLVMMLTVGTVATIATYQAVTHTEQPAEAQTGGWRPTWDCIEGVALTAWGLWGVISSMFQPPTSGVNWKFVWGNSAWAIGAYRTFYSCLDELRNRYGGSYSSAAGCTYWPNKVLREDFIHMWPDWYFGQNQWWNAPCQPSPA